MSNSIQKIDNTQAIITAGFGNSMSFDFMQRQATMLASSALMPKEFSVVGIRDPQERAQKVANVIIALEMANRIGASPMMVAQNLYIVHGKPSWSSTFIIAAINGCGRFSAMKFEMSGNGEDRTCVAVASERATGERLESPPVSIAMAKAEGWFSKTGSKWKTMPELMLRYRAATLFGRLYAPEILMGMRSVEELEDIQDANVRDVTPLVPASKAILEGFGVPENIIPENKEPVPPSTEKPEENTESNAIDEEVISADEEVIPADKLTFMYLEELSDLTGETQDDLIDTFSKSKYGCLAELMGALNDKTKLTMAYLSDVLVPTMKAKVEEMKEAE
jgi:hypothetical protein